MLGWWRVVSLMPSSLQFSILMLSLRYQWRNKPTWYTEHEVMQTYSMKHEVQIAVLIRDVESNLKVEAERPSETFVTTYRTTRRHNSEDHNSNHRHILNILMKVSHLTGHKGGGGFTMDAVICLYKMDLVEGCTNIPHFSIYNPLISL